MHKSNQRRHNKMQVGHECRDSITLIDIL